MSSKPTLVLVPGSWHTIDTWNKVVKIMEAKGLKCVPVALPSTNGSRNIGFEDDVAAVRTAIVQELDSRKDVVLVVHSYGGQVGTLLSAKLEYYKEILLMDCR